jgi:cell pole-organizing protein PopZ
LAQDNDEPSVEDILASIKKVMAADNQAARNISKSRNIGASYTAPTRADDDPILELGAFEQARDDKSREEGRSHADDDSANPLIAEDGVDSVRSSLEALAALSMPGKAPQIVRSGETSLEGLVREMLRPMLKNWLDENLPPLVEQMVAGEIRRITRKEK